MNCGGPPPCRALVETLNNYLNVLGYGFWVLNQTSAEQRAAEKPVCAPFSSIEEHSLVLP